MASSALQTVADAVVQLAKRQGFVTMRDIRAELRIAGQPEKDWKAVVAHAQPPLLHKQGRYYHRDGFSPRLQKERAQQKAIQKVIRRLVKQHKGRAKADDRRTLARIDFIQPVKVRTEEGKEYALLSRDVSATGIRLIGTKRLLGQKVQIELVDGSGEPACRLAARILWTCAVGDDLFENGGNFLELLT